MTAPATLVSEPSEVGLPPLDATTARRVQVGPATVFGGDGFPHRRHADGAAVPHPILGTYLLKGYLDAYERSGQYDQLQAASVVARGALARMQEFRGSRAFWYQPGWKLSSWVSRPHYSALTQAYYGVELARLARLSDDPRMAEAADEVMRSLLVPVADGGVLVTVQDNPAFEEAPVQPVSLILNGWLSVLASTTRYAELSGIGEWRDLVVASLDAVERILPWYDVGTLALSRYSLLGYLYGRLRLQGGETRVRAARLEASGGPPVDIPWVPADEGQGRYRSWFNPADVNEYGVLSRTARVNLVPTRFGWPVRNVLVLQLDSEQSQTCALDLQETHYDPLAPAPVPDGWQRVARFGLAPGRNDVRIELPWTAMPLVGFPTNFRKRTPAGVSAYHDIHVKRLQALGEDYDRPELLAWSALWREYQKRWPQVPELAALYGEESA